MLSGKPTPYPMSGIWNSVSVSFYLLMQTKISARYESIKRYVYDGLAKGVLKPRVDRIFPFYQVVDAYRYLESNQQVGKIVITL
jgi:NADPH:quinone reductase-like Zn-dependent oxidoreductase